MALLTSFFFTDVPICLPDSRVVRDLFLSCNGLNQVTELVYLDATRSWALKVFETLILCTWEQQAETTALQELERAEALERDAVLGLVTDLGSRDAGGGGGAEGGQSLSKFYEGLREAYPRRKSRSGGSAMGAGHQRGEAQLNAINLFLCVAFLCVSKEADSDRDSANDSEDTSGYDSTASEPLGSRLPCLSPDSVALPSKEQVRRAADVWSVCRWVYLASPAFQRQFFRLGGLEVCSRLMTMVIQKLSSCKTKDGGKPKKKRDAKGKASPSHPGSPAPYFSPTQTPTPSPAPPDSAAACEEAAQQAEAKGPGVKDPARRLEEEWSLQSIRLLEALLAICLHSATASLQKTEPDLSLQVRQFAA